MIKYKHLTVENYKSILFAEITFTPGVFKVVGKTINGHYTSNGSGKSSILQSLVLVLYNKDFQGAPIESLSNRFTGKPFKLTLLLDVDRDGRKSEYTIINDRSTKRITIKHGDTIISSQTAKSLKIILDLVGMSENTFKFTHYITTNSILELTKNISNATLFNEVLQVVQLKTMGQDLMSVRKQLLKDKDRYLVTFTELNSARKLLKVTTEYDVEAISDELKVLRRELEKYKELYSTSVAPIKETIIRLTENLRALRQETRQKKQSNTTGVCTMCGSVMEAGALVTLLYDIATLEETSLGIVEEISSNEAIFDRLSLAYSAGTQVLNEKINRLAKDLTMGNQLQDIHKELLSGSASFSEARFKAVSKKLDKTKKMLDGIDTMRDAIRSGIIFEDVMKDFFTLVNINIQKYRQVINLTSFDIEATSFKAGMVILLRVDGEVVTVESLSNGEKARLSLLVLVALLEAMQQTAQSNSNFISFDEATSSFDVSGIEELRQLFSHMKALDQACFVITHGSELHTVEYDGTLTMIKEDNVTTSEFTKD